MNKIVLSGIIFFLFIIRFSLAQPTYSLNSTNNTAAGKPTLFSLNWTSNIGLSGYTFSTNNMGAWQNETWRDFENQSGNALFIDRFESGNFNAWNLKNATAGGGIVPVDQNAVVHGGSYAAKFVIGTAAGGGYSILTDNLRTTYTKLYARAYCQFNATSITPGNYIYLGPTIDSSVNGYDMAAALITNQGGTIKWGLRYEVNEPTKKFDYNNTGPTISTNTWYNIEVMASTSGGGSGEVSMWVNGIKVLDETGLNNNFEPLGIYQLGSYSNNTLSSAIAIYCDDAVISTSYIDPYSSWSNVTKTLNSNVGTAVQWCIYANDTNNGWNTSSCVNPFSLTTTSNNIAPLWFSNSTNNTVAGKPTLFSLNWTSASGYIFSFDNGTGKMMNDTFVNFGEINLNSADATPMQALWHMNGNVVDSSGKNNNGQMKGTVNCSMLGKFGNACFFDNSQNDYINIGNSTSVNFNASANFTWSLWMNRITSTDWDVLMGNLNWKISGLRLVVKTDGTVSLLNSANDGSGTISKIGTGQWYMITVVYTPAHQDIYINGAKMSTSGTGTFVSNRATNLTIGFSNTNKEQFSGYIDEVAIWNRSLSSAEILKLYNNGYSTWSNVTKVINSTIGTNISWMVYANSTTNSWNATSVFSFLTTSSGSSPPEQPPSVTILSPSNTTYTTNWVWANVTLNKAGSWCGVSLNNTANQTMTNSTGNWNLNLSVPSFYANKVTFCCNDTYNNMNCSMSQYFTVSPVPPISPTSPIWSNLGESATSIAPNGTVILSAQVTSALPMDWTVLSTNETGVWANVTWYDPLHLNSYKKWHTNSDTLDNSVYVADLDGDGKMEILTLGEYYDSTDDSMHAQLRIWRYTATNATIGTLDVLAEKDWNNNSEAYGYSVVVDDLNHDGHKKIITCGVTGGVWNYGDLRIWNYTNGTINLEAVKDWYTANVTNYTSAWSVTTSDINDDGHDEIITSGMFNESDYPVYISQLRVWNYTNGVINLIASNEWYTGGRTEAQSVIVGDLAGDGTKKIVVDGLSTGGARYQAEVSIFNLTNNVLMLENRTNWHGLGDTIVYSVAIGDVNNDGVPELVTGGLERNYYDDINYTRRSAQLRIWNYANKQLNLKDDEIWYVPKGGDSEVYSLVINDINKDGIPEIVTAGLSNNEYGPGNIDRGQVRIWTYVNNVLSLKKENLWADGIGVLEGELDDSLKVADLDGDGINEIITGGRTEDNPNSGILRVYSTGNIYGSPMNLTKIANTWLWSNFTWRNTSISSGLISWRIYYNNSIGNWNVTDIKTFSIS